MKPTIIHCLHRGRQVRGFLHPKADLGAQVQAHSTSSFCRDCICHSLHCKPYNVNFFSTPGARPWAMISERWSWSSFYLLQDYPYMSSVPGGNEFNVHRAQWHKEFTGLVRIECPGSSCCGTLANDLIGHPSIFQTWMTNSYPMHTPSQHTWTLILWVF